MLKNLLETNKCFKLVCGAGNEDIEEIKRLVYIYALAGCRFFDLTASEEALKVAKEALNLAKVKDAFLCVSVGIKNDPHVNKAVIDYDRCVNCGACEAVCLQGAIHYAKVKSYKCIGCGKCWRVCSRAAISYRSEEKNLSEILPLLIKNGIDCIEFHAMGLDEEEIYSKWKYINEIYDGMLSICTSRGKLSDEGLVARVKEMIKGRKPYSTIIQADGFPMSGGEDTYKSTLQAVATAEIIQNEKLSVHIMLSGGTNSKTTELAKMCEINYCGVAIGSYARKIVKRYISRSDFWSNPRVVEDAVNIAKPLVESVVSK
jgi:ferredoxin